MAPYLMERMCGYFEESYELWLIKCKSLKASDFYIGAIQRGL